jgi:hypothetical protein
MTLTQGEENLKWRKFNAEATDLELLTSNVNSGKT